MVGQGPSERGVSRSRVGAVVQAEALPNRPHPAAAGREERAGIRAGRVRVRMDYLATPARGWNIGTRPRKHGSTGGLGRSDPLEHRSEQEIGTLIKWLQQKRINARSRKAGAPPGCTPGI